MDKGRGYVVGLRMNDTGEGILVADIIVARHHPRSRPMELEPQASDLPQEIRDALMEWLHKADKES